jgi:hypothetical protein
MSDNVNHPDHYTGFSNGSEVIDITENLNFNLGNVVKYVARAGRKNDKTLEDLRKAQWYLDREISRLDTEDLLAESMSLIYGDFKPKSGLPEGLSYELDRTWRDSEGWLWKWDGEGWLYFEKDDEEWIEVKGPPSNIYAPFEEVDLWQEGS